MIQVQGVSSQDVDQVWEVLSPMLQKALDRTAAAKLYTLDSIRQSLLERNMQLWMVVEKHTIIATAVTQVLIYPKTKVLDVLFLGGSQYDLWRDTFNDLMAEYGRASGCTLARGYGRLGWAKKAKHLGIQPNIYFDVNIGETRNETIH